MICLLLSQCPRSSTVALKKGSVILQSAVTNAGAVSIIPSFLRWIEHGIYLATVDTIVPFLARTPRQLHAFQHSTFDPTSDSRHIDAQVLSDLLDGQQFGILDGHGYSSSVICDAPVSGSVASLTNCLM